MYYEDSFDYEGNRVKFSVSSERGLEFLSDGINQYHRSGFKRCVSEDKKRTFDIFYQYWLTNPSNPSILFFHGNAENSCTHPKFFYHLLLNGFNIFTFDNIGHGSSSGLRGSIEKYSDYLNVADQMYEYFNNEKIKNTKIQNKKDDKKQNKSKDKENNKFIDENRWIIIGFSFGGLITADFSLSTNFSQIMDVILFSPWFATHKRLINNLTKLYLYIFHRFFSPKNLMNYKIQEDVLKMDTESYIKLNKNLTDNEEFLRIRKKDIRIFRVISKKRLAEIYKSQLRLLKTKNTKNLNFYLFLPEKDIIVDSNISQKIIKNFNGEIFNLKECYHDFLDYSDSRWEDFSKKLNICLTKIVK